MIVFLIGSNPYPLDVAESERARMISEAATCYLCHKRFEEEDIKCLDHNHVLSGRPLGINKNLLFIPKNLLFDPKIIIFYPKNYFNRKHFI